MTGAKVPLNDGELALVDDTREVLAQAFRDHSEAAVADDLATEEKERKRIGRLKAVLHCFGARVDA